MFDKFDIFRQPIFYFYFYFLLLLHAMYQYSQENRAEVLIYQHNTYWFNLTHPTQPQPQLQPQPRKLLKSTSSSMPVPAEPDLLRTRFIHCRKILVESFLISEENESKGEVSM